MQAALAFPADRAAGYDPAHIAASPLMRFSAVAMGGDALVPVFLAGQATVAGASSVKATSFGPAVSFASGANANIYPSYAGTETPTAITMAVIFTPASGATGYVIINCAGIGQANPITGIYLSTLAVNLIIQNSVRGPTFTLTAGVPCFLVVSTYNLAGANTVVAAAVNLLTGQTTTGVSGPFPTTIQATTTATYAVGDSASGINSAPMSVNAAMYSIAYTPLAVMLAWAQDPWAFWYPRSDDFINSLLVQAPAVVSSGAQARAMVMA